MPKQDILNASFEQERAWLATNLRPGGLPFASFRAIRLSKSISIPVLDEALRNVAREHEILRTTLTLGSDSVLQVIHTETDCATEYH
jgi:hypothetical protein